MSQWAAPEWVDYLDGDSGSVYYLHLESGESCWEKPSAFVADAWDDSDQYDWSEATGEVVANGEAGYGGGGEAWAHVAEPVAAVDAALPPPPLRPSAPPVSPAVAVVVPPPLAGSPPPAYASVVAGPVVALSMDEGASPPLAHAPPASDALSLVGPPPRATFAPPPSAPPPRAVAKRGPPPVTGPSGEAPGASSGAADPEVGLSL